MANEAKDSGKVGKGKEEVKVEGAKPVEAAKPKPERIVETVTMTDGRKVDFINKRKVSKESTVSPDGVVSVRMDFRNGQTRTFVCPPSLITRAAAHGLEQKLGDETAGTEKIEDMVLDVEDLMARLASGEWNVQREAGGFSGASVVIRAVAEVSGKSIEAVKAFFQAKLDAAKAANQTLSRKALYDSFRDPASKVGAVIERLEREERAGKSAVDSNSLLAELSA